jgi:hypothetical protein
MGVGQGITAIFRCNNDKLSNSEMSPTSCHSELSITGGAPQGLSSHQSQGSFAVQAQ